MSRDAYLAIESIAGHFCLMLGCLGQAAFASPVLKPHLGSWFGGVIVILPWLIVYTVTFLNQPFLSPCAFRHCLLFAMCWFAALTIVAEVLCHLGCMPPGSPAYAFTASRILMHVGWLSLVPLVRVYFATLHHESTRHA